jgi:hypothetical protein
MLVSKGFFYDLRSQDLENQIESDRKQKNLIYHPKKSQIK